ncbi:MAG: agmatine deiminase family protein [Muribaculum sp.]|nr:agmatine deiminase family protein [Muribaculum sp.]
MNRSDSFDSLRRLPAEWEGHDCVLLAWPHEMTDWNYMLDEAQDCFARIIKEIAKEECVLLVGPADLCKRSIEKYDFPIDRVKFLNVPTNDTWARDFGGITIEENGTLTIVDFKFNGWGLKFASNLDNLVTRRLCQEILNIKPIYENRLNFVLEGGSIESDGEGTILTTSECLLSPNRNGQFSRDEITAYLKTVLGASHILWLDYGSITGDDTDSHIDTLARFAPHDTILYVGCGEENDSNNGSLSLMREQLMGLRTPTGNSYNLIELPLPDPIYDESGMQLPATYANFLITPKRILLPVYNQYKKDLLASQILKIAFPDHEVVPIDCRALIQQHGSLHCVTMQFPAGTIASIQDGKWTE